MSLFPTPADRRDGRAGDRDDAADDRDTTSEDRDDAAGRRDAEATERDRRASQDTRDLNDRLERLRLQFADQYARAENTTVDPADWPDLTPADLDRLRARAAEQRRLAAVDRAAVTRLLTDMHSRISQVRGDRHAAAADRRAAAQDRRASADDRHSSAQDRHDAARDRSQVAIEREQTVPPDRRDPGQARADESLTDRARKAVYESRQRIADSRAFLTRARLAEPPTVDPDHGPADG